jgi:hypothetical protein
MMTAMVVLLPALTALALNHHPATYHPNKTQVTRPNRRTIKARPTSHLHLLASTCTRLTSHTQLNSSSKRHTHPTTLQIMLQADHSRTRTALRAAPTATARQT